MSWIASTFRGCPSGPYHQDVHVMSLAVDAVMVLSAAALVVLLVDRERAVRRERRG
ncbi:hypothetical protein ACQEVF_37860 [Nonomuraea polychroma]|uniref:hypothetical protein n=1 Tax=Nonomuraea polychroma TaxID=46176 RepID=UPI003D9501A1